MARRSAFAFIASASPFERDPAADVVTSTLLPAEPQTLAEVAAYKADVAARLSAAQAELEHLRERVPSDDRRRAIREAVDVVDELLDAQRFAEAREAELRQREGTNQDFAFVPGVGHDNRATFTSACGLAVVFGGSTASCAAAGPVRGPPPFLL
jgi:hypothetical protein